MKDQAPTSTVTVLVVGAGPAGLATAIQIKTLQPDLDVCVIDKAQGLGHHNLSGAVLEAEPLFSLLHAAAPGWQETEAAKEVLANRIDRDDILFLPGSKRALPIEWALKMARAFRLGFGQMLHRGDYSVSISSLVRWMGRVATALGAEVLTGFAAGEILYDEKAGRVTGVRLVDQGLDKHGQPQPNLLKGEVIQARMVVLAEGCDGLLTEQLVLKAGLRRRSPQLYSVGVKELIQVSPDQYHRFGPGRVVHAMGWPIWTPVRGPGMFGGGIVYAGQPDRLAVGMIVGADWKYRDFNPEDALARFKQHRFVRSFIEGGQVVEAGAKMIPEGGFHSIPRDPLTGAIGKGNCMIVGDGAGLVNMLKIKGLHNAIDSGMLAAQAIVEQASSPDEAASCYTQRIVQSPVMAEMRSARNYRQTVARWGPLIGLPMSVLDGLLPKWVVEEDYKAMTKARYRLRPERAFDKDQFVAMAGSTHREEQPNHLTILDPEICVRRCQPTLDAPCVVFCPAGVYESIDGQIKPANPSNCLHCKTCQRKCPFDNIRWTVPEGGGGPRYAGL
ncbi:MAG: FAD-dependent oxidoreductase [Phycisphaerae bacterium]|nr:FAD-dependent oxidoreductase [Phycisphaerae bacterium]